MLSVYFTLLYIQLNCFAKGSEVTMALFLFSFIYFSQGH